MKNITFEQKKYDLMFSKKIKIIFLKNWSFVTITGKDCFNYLQSKLTFDLFLLKKKQHVICSHCAINGKVISIIRLFIYNNGYAYIQRKSTSESQINELKKYAIFSRVNICENEDILLLGIMGLSASKKLLNIFKSLPDSKNSIYEEDNIIILKFHKPFERFIIIINKKHPVLKKILTLKYKTYSDKIWLASDIASDIPIIENCTSKKFFPQSLNLEKLNGLNLKKGCYHGQEMIAKVHFKKLNKYHLYFLIGNSHPQPKIRDKLEFKKNEQFLHCGWILSIVNLSTTQIWIQAVLKNNNNYINHLIRIQNNINSYFYIYK